MAKCRCGRSKAVGARQCGHCTQADIRYEAERDDASAFVDIALGTANADKLRAGVDPYAQPDGPPVVACVACGQRWLVESDRYVTCCGYRYAASERGPTVVKV